MTDVTQHFTVGEHSANSLKPEPVWYGSTDQVAIPKAGKEAEPVTIIADTLPGGTVQIQMIDSNGDWRTLSNPEYTISGVFSSVQLYSQNTPGYRVIATGAAKYRVISNDPLAV